MGMAMMPAMAVVHEQVHQRTGEKQDIGQQAQGMLPVVLETRKPLPREWRQAASSRIRSSCDPSRPPKASGAVGAYRLRRLRASGLGRRRRARRRHTVPHHMIAAHVTRMVHALHALHVTHAVRCRRAAGHVSMTSLAVMHGVTRVPALGRSMMMAHRLCRSSTGAGEQSSRSCGQEKRLHFHLHFYRHPVRIRRYGRTPSNFFRTRSECRRPRCAPSCPCHRREHNRRSFLRPRSS